MENEKIISSVALTVFIIIAIVCIAELIINAYVNKKSTAIDSLKKLNVRYQNVFCTFKDKYCYIKQNKSKSAFDRTDYAKVLKEYYLINEPLFLNLLSQIKYNKQKFAEYQKECDYIYKYRSVEWDKKGIFQNREKKLFQYYMLKLRVDINIIIRSEYTSPKGKNSYSGKREYNINDLEKVINTVRQQSEYKKSKEYQRTLMTDKLRYDVLKRDNFRCKLCGISAKEGATLHVDHILPVSKGGKTEMTNLRTLCDRCNLGKGAKYDANGLN
ncbi:MAG: HNH endonuclease [Clostridia bacterium]|nr:HNH endonuclease [Clostridia bacterium]